MARGPTFDSRQYDKIPIHGKNAIRLLKVYPGALEQVEVQCELVLGTVYDDDNLEVQFRSYEILSWCWGHTHSKAWISVLQDGVKYVKYVAQAVVAALRALRHETYVKFLWIDAICVDQTNKAEKNVSIFNELAMMLLLN